MLQSYLLFPKFFGLFDDLFLNCGNLISLDLSNFDISNANSLKSTFEGCKSLTNLKIDNWYSKYLNDVSNMFKGCESLKELNINNLLSNDENIIRYTTEMFSGCQALTSLDISNFNTRLVDDMNKMFYDTKSLKYLDISKFITTGLGNDTLKDIFTNINNGKNMSMVVDTEDKCKNLKDFIPENVKIIKPNTTIDYY